MKFIFTTMLLFSSLAAFAGGDKGNGTDGYTCFDEKGEEIEIKESLSKRFRVETEFEERSAEGMDFESLKEIHCYEGKLKVE